MKTPYSGRRHLIPHSWMRRAATAMWPGLTLLNAAFGAATPPPVDDALKRATAYLLAQQEPDGSTGKPYFIANTSLTVLALATCGHQPAQPTPEGQAMRKALDFLLLPQHQTKDGFFGLADHSRMYGHGITTLLLAEMLGMGADEKQDAAIRERCRLGLDYILRAQSMRKAPLHEGGWRYTVDSLDSDLSVTVWQTMALRAAQNAGLEVPREAVAQAVSYMKRLYAPLGSGDPPVVARAPLGEAAKKPSFDPRNRTAPGGFGYQMPGHTTSTTAEGLLAMQVCGEYEAAETRGAAEHLFRTGLKQSDHHFFYTVYYYAQGMYQRGGQYAAEAHDLVPQILVPMQAREGSWTGIGDEAGAGRVYATSMAVLALAVKNHFLPIYQR